MGPCFSAPAPKDFAPYAVAGAGAPDVLFFPDGKMPCRAVMRGGECRRGDACEYAHGRTSLTRLLDVINAATKTLDVCVFTITCNEIADAVVDGPDFLGHREAENRMWVQMAVMEHLAGQAS